MGLGRAIAKHYRLAGIATTVDAVHGAAQLGRFAEALRQVAVADRLIVTKTDVARSDDTITMRTRSMTCTSTGITTISANRA